MQRTYANTNKINMDTFDKIIYSNHFKVDDRTFAFRKKRLFDITNTPRYLPEQNNSGSIGYWLNRKWFSLTKIKSIILNEPINIDITGLQWYQQIELTECFNLDKYQ
jgi:hypothetical protein